MKESIYSKLFEGYSLSEEMFLHYTENLHERMGIFTTDEHGTITGIGVFDILPWVGTDAPIRMARISFIYVKPEYRRLGYGKEIQTAFEHWGKAVGATFYSSGHKTKGYKKYETIYMKEVT